MVQDPAADMAEAHNRQVRTYHCLCTQLVLASNASLSDFAVRKSDQSIICPLVPGHSNSLAARAMLHHTVTAAKPIVLQLDDGYEKRWEQICPRCETTLGYQLDMSQYDPELQSTGRRDDVIYLLPGGLMTTQDMMEGKDMDGQIGLVAQPSKLQ